MKNWLFKFLLLPLATFAIPFEGGAQTLDQGSNIPKVRELLLSIESGDTTAAEKYLSPITYLQHVPTAPDGREATIAMIKASPAAHTKIEIGRIFEDRDFVIAHFKRTRNGKPMAVVSIWRFNDEGQAVEHWEGGQDMPSSPNISGHTMIDGESEVKDLDKTVSNQNLVGTFMQDVFRKGNYRNSTQYISDTTYIQHNPKVGDGLEGFIKAISYLSSTFKEQVTKKILGQGNFVLVVSDLKNNANYDIFRMEEGKIVEHWDLQSPIPPTSEFKNNNGVF